MHAEVEEKFKEEHKNEITEADTMRHFKNTDKSRYETTLADLEMAAGYSAEPAWSKLDFLEPDTFSLEIRGKKEENQIKLLQEQIGRLK